MSKRLIYVVGGDESYSNWMCGRITKNMEKANLVVFVGGEDVDPSVYGKKRNPLTESNLRRDLYEKAQYENALALGKHIIGICRGSQLLCALNGGILVQHQDNPSFIHRLHTFDGAKEMFISSTHHQAQYPFLMDKADYKILAWTNGISNFHLGQTYTEELNPPRECEIVLYPKTKCLGIQGHPEMLYHHHKTTHGIYFFEYMRGMLDKFMEDKL